MNAHNIDYFGCPQINLDTTQQAVQQTLKKITKAAFSQSSIQFGSTPIPTKHFYKPGATMYLFKGDINSQKIDQGSNKYGRWSYFKFTTADAKIVTVITAYKPCTAASTTGATTYHQQLALQQLETNTTVNLRKTFISDLLRRMKSAKSCGKLFILLGGSFNEMLHSMTDTIKLCYDNDLQLVDVLGDLANSQISTMKTGKSRIDYILMSPEIAVTIQKKHRSSWNVP
eukprot:5411032-Ditylum_brightwellii.AAC.1